MRYLLLGKTGLRVSEICLGAMTFGEDWGWGAPKQTSAQILDLFMEAGGNFIDTANAYTNGSSERMLGDLLRERRDNVVLATKYTLQTRAGDVNSAGNHRKSLVSALEASLRRLNTDHIDIYWVHARDSFTPVEEVMRALDDQVRAGKVLYVGVSDWPAWEVAQANTLAELRGWSAFAGLQVQYSLIERTPERELLPMANVFDLGVTAWGPLGMGLLTGKYLTEAGGGAGARMNVVGEGGMPVPVGERTDRIVREVVEVAKEGGWTPAQVALAWLRSRPGVVIPIVGTTKPHQLTDNLGSLEVRLDQTALDRLNQVSRVEAGFPYDFLRSDGVKPIVYGDRREAIADRRRAARAMADDLF